jgi:hypothetical protein
LKFDLEYYHQMYLIMKIAMIIHQFANETNFQLGLCFHLICRLFHFQF